IRKHCPDVQLFTLDNHLLYTHPDYADVFQGMLVATTYPLFVDTQQWHMACDREAPQFSTTTSQGVHNALLALLDEMQGSEQPHGARLLDYETPFARSINEPVLPALWLVAVGSNGFWPVRVFPMVKDDSLLPPEKLPGRAKWFASQYL